MILVFLTSQPFLTSINITYILLALSLPSYFAAKTPLLSLGSSFIIILRSKNTAAITWPFFYHHSLQQKHRCYLSSLLIPTSFLTRTSLLFIGSFLIIILCNKNIVAITWFFLYYQTLQQKHCCSLLALPFTSNLASETPLLLPGSFLSITIFSYFFLIIDSS